jgi:hypothetical protein
VRYRLIPGSSVHASAKLAGTAGVLPEFFSSDEAVTLRLPPAWLEIAKLRTSQ